MLALAAGVGWWARRWRNRPEMIAWAVAVALALRLCFEVTMTDYYVWPALAVGLVVAARCSRLRFAISIVVAILTTVIAQWNLGWLPWWSIEVAGTAGLLIITSRPVPLGLAREQGPQPRRATAAVQGRARSSSEPVKKDAPNARDHQRWCKAARSRGRGRRSALVQSRSGLVAADVGAARSASRRSMPAETASRPANQGLPAPVPWGQVW